MMTLRFGTIVMTTTLALAVVGVGCGGGGSSGSGGGNPTSGGTGGAGGGAMEQAVNGCTAAKAKDETSSSNVTVKFGGTSPGLAYSPSCFKIKKGSKVTFEGDFSLHPISGGTVSSDMSMNTPDPKSPIAATSGGMSKTFTFPDAGTFGFFCQVHFGVGMEGAVIVE